jgi:hypothetical protein
MVEKSLIKTLKTAEEKVLILAQTSKLWTFHSPSTLLKALYLHQLIYALVLPLVYFSSLFTLSLPSNVNTRICSTESGKQIIKKHTKRIFYPITCLTHIADVAKRCLLYLWWKLLRMFFTFFVSFFKYVIKVKAEKCVI